MLAAFIENTPFQDVATGIGMIPAREYSGYVSAWSLGSKDDMLVETVRNGGWLIPLSRI
jgi:hypothetical protein